MKTSNYTFKKKGNAWNWTVLVLTAMMALSSCIIVTDHDGHGTFGQDGKAYFGIDYDWNPPYSYWDDNPSVPDNPFFGEFYRTMGGIYDFEYFVDPYEYWYGTYEIYVNPGEAGGPYGEDGLDGKDNFLLLICNENGFYFEGWENCDCWRQLEDGTIVVEKNEGGQRYKVTMKKTTVSERPTTNAPKFRAEEN